MRIWFFILFFAVIGQRIFELFVAKQNAAWMKERGGYEVGKDHYKWIIVIHIMIFCGVVAEYLFWDIEPPRFWKSLFLVFLSLQFLRAWCIQSLGRFWNTRIFILPGKVVRRGIYNYLRHPNYLIVMIETAIFPALFGAYLTAFLLPIINGLFLTFVRIPTEERALREETSY